MSPVHHKYELPGETAVPHPREREQDALYRAYVFGQFRLFCQGKPIKEAMWRRSKVRVLLKWFLLNPGKLCSADEFIELFWPDIPLETAASNLHVTIHCLRHLLEPSLGPRAMSRYIRRQSNKFYWFEMDETWWTDLTEVQQLFETARMFDARKDDVRASFYYRKIVSYCSLGLLPEDEAEEWLRPYRQRYEHIYIQVLVRLIQIYQQRNELDEVLEYAYLALSLDPYCEPAVKAIIDAYVKQGNTTKAMHRLDNFRLFLQEELGIEPSKEIHSLQTKIIKARK